MENGDCLLSSGTLLVVGCTIAILTNGLGLALFVLFTGTLILFHLWTAAKLLEKPSSEIFFKGNVLIAILINISYFSSNSSLQDGVYYFCLSSTVHFVLVWSCMFCKLYLLPHRYPKASVVVLPIADETTAEVVGTAAVSVRGGPVLVGVYTVQ